MSKFLTLISGAVEVVAGVVVGVIAGWTGVGLYAAIQLFGLGVATILSGTGTLLAGSGGKGGPQGSQGGISSAVRNPIQSWIMNYGRAVTGGSFVPYAADK
jgi:hypothetical protein